MKPYRVELEKRVFHDSILHTGEKYSIILEHARPRDTVMDLNVIYHEVCSSRFYSDSIWDSAIIHALQATEVDVPVLNYERVGRCAASPRYSARIVPGNSKASVPNNVYGIMSLQGAHARYRRNPTTSGKA